MDAVDLQIIRELQTDGRLSNQELADRVRLSPSPCLRRVRRLEEAGLIRGYTAMVDQVAFGLPVTVFVRIRLERHTAEAVRLFEEHVAVIEHIQDCYLMAGSSDYLLRVVIEDLEAYEALVRHRIHAIPGIASIESSFAYGSVKQSRTYPRPAPGGSRRPRGT
ncbi:MULTISPECIES: Lrp/AsnC family transcriptional regulator [Streptomyces]|uniref:AsnC family transcriptional regulator n=1 Tax=Streptomyces virginiae TaxID=1961 RepID=A0ABQ3NHJ5_STRVG|nr:MULTISPECIES: Lrp/AsnC family transcriptional regulator [Streptomyces]GLV89135.1 AsnC family transcriptional regulator [Streptomyces lavendulae subsp. lavendulae]KOU10835.1 AsnC family transcriptional regulator [Streptomyces sp. WM6349]KOU84953.1 AsnC family transcriptional regulator [Streptomyces sp. XY593]KOU96078.1 AsnC family transcriptional regulator [Streptomyces sp. XY511]KOU98700.1 AsnC family transcriptional regulator [Streptomyces sp. XY533]